VKISAVAFNPVDYKMRQGNFGGEFPLVLGSDASGVVEEVAEDVKSFKKGDEVMVFPFGTGKSNGSYAEYMTVSQYLIGHKPKNVSLVDAAAIPLVALTTHECVMRRSKVNKGDAAFVVGASGGTGSFAIQFLQLQGADPIIVTAGSEESASYIRENFGIPNEHIVRYKVYKSTEALAGHVKSLTRDGQGVAFAYDLHGGDMKTACFYALKLGGHVVTIVEEDPKYVTPLYASQTHNCLFMKNGDLSTVFIGAAAFAGGPDSWKQYNEDLEYIARLFETGKLKLPKITIVGHFSSETVKDAHNRLEKGSTTGKLIMQVP